MKDSEIVDSNTQFSYLGWLNKIINLTDQANGDIFMKKEVTDELIQEGMILDAQDYLGEWHLSIVCKVDHNEDAEFARLNFLRYPKGNRDEWYTRAEVKERIAGPFAKVEVQRDESIISKLNNLREYYKKYKSSQSKKGNDPKKSAKKDDNK